VAPNGGVVPLTTATRNGTAIDNTGGQISLAANQTYSVSYNAVVFSPTNQAVAQLNLNGSPIIGTVSIASNIPAVGTTVTGQSIINTTTASTLTLINGGTSLETFGGTISGKGGACALQSFTA